MIGDTADRNLDARTVGKVGTTRKFFHTAYSQERFTTHDGHPGNRNVARRCTCDSKYNHA